MNDTENLLPPTTVRRIEIETRKLGFKMASDYQTGSLLRSLASSKPAGKILELGTGTGLSAAWMLDGMDGTAQLVSVDNYSSAVQVARDVLGSDHRVEFHIEDGAVFLRSQKGKKFDLIFADTWPGKVNDLDLALDLLADGGIYVVDDMSHQPHWDKLDWDHSGDIKRVIQALDEKEEFLRTKLTWSTGIIIVTKRPNQTPETRTTSGPVSA